MTEKTPNEIFWESCDLIEEDTTGGMLHFYFVKQGDTYHIFEVSGPVDEVGHDVCRVTGCFHMPEELAPGMSVHTEDDDISFKKIGSKGTKDFEEAKARWNLHKEYIHLLRTGYFDDPDHPEKDWGDTFTEWAEREKKATREELYPIEEGLSMGETLIRIEEKEEKKWGGARPGSGRKPGQKDGKRTACTKQVCMTPELWEKVEKAAKVACLTRSEWIRRAILDALNR